MRGGCDWPRAWTVLLRHMSSVQQNGISALLSIRHSTACMVRRTFGRWSRVWRNGKTQISTNLRILRSFVMVLCYPPPLLFAVSTPVIGISRVSASIITARRTFITTAGNPFLLSVTIKQHRVRLIGHIARLGEEVPTKIICTVSRPLLEGWRRPTWVSHVSADRPLGDRPEFKRLVTTIT